MVILNDDLQKRYNIDKIFATPEEDGTVRLDIRIFTGESTEKHLEKLKVRAGQITTLSGRTDENLTAATTLGDGVRPGHTSNVVMEEGVFRGLFQKILENKFSFIPAAVIASVLLGLWHIMAPIRSFYDGTMNTGGFIANMIMLVVTSTLMGFKFAMMTKITGSLYMAMGDHFVNNTIVNMLHVVTDTGADELMVVRISIAQSVSFIAVLIWYVVKKKHATLSF